MDTLVSLKVLNTVAATKGFAKAARRLGMSAATVTKHIQHLEKQVGARLINRTSRKVSLSEAGELYLKTVTPFLNSLDEAENTVKGATQTPQGTLRLSLPVWMAEPGILNLIKSFHDLYPEVMLECDLSGRPVSLVEEGFDIVLRAGDTASDGLVGRVLSEIRFSLVATSDFIKSYKPIVSTADLDGIPFLAYSRVVIGDSLAWKNENVAWSFRCSPVLRSENETFILHAAMQGMGAAMLPNLLTQRHVDSGELVRLLPEQIYALAPLSALYPDRNYLPAKTRHFIDFWCEYGVV